MPRHDPEGGYASLTAIILCAALSLLCTGMITLAMSQARSARRALFREQQTEAIHTALLRMGARIAGASGGSTLDETLSLTTPQGDMKVAVRAEQETRKWSRDAVDEVSAERLSAYTSLDAKELQQPQNDDCLRTLFSVYGQTAPDHDWPKPVGLIATGGHDGEVWRMRGVSGNHVIEQTVRFLGDPRHVFAVVSQEDRTVGDMPTCRYLKMQP